MWSACLFIFAKINYQLFFKIIMYRYELIHKTQKLVNLLHLLDEWKWETVQSSGQYFNSLSHLFLYLFLIHFYSLVQVHLEKFSLPPKKCDTSKKLPYLCQIIYNGGSKILYRGCTLRMWQVEESFLCLQTWIERKLNQHS